MEINDTRVGDVLLTLNDCLAVILEKNGGDAILIGYVNDDGSFNLNWMRKYRAVYFRKNFSLVVKANDGNYCR